MLREIELKNIQINSQEQMLERRNQEIISLKSKFDSNQSLNSEHNIDTNRVKSLEADKAKLIKDNVTLMNLNYNLNSSYKQLLEKDKETVRQLEVNTNINLVF